MLLLWSNELCSNIVGGIKIGTYIKNFYPRDQKALIAISRCGHCSKEQLNLFIKDKRISSYEKDKLITKEVFTNFNGETFIGYKLTSCGRKFVEKKYGFKGHQKAQSIAHDLRIANKYFSLTEKERDTWTTESELRERYKDILEQIRQEDPGRYDELKQLEEEHKISAVDCSYITRQNVEIAFEVVTKNYGRQELEAKERFVEILKIEYENERV